MWSAGCATGEEAYTLALEAVLALGAPPSPVDVLGTDISTAALAAAAAGRYGERAVRQLDPAVRERYLTRQPDGRYQVTAPLRALARFGRHNLALSTGPPPGEAAFDVVVCRNVLIYLSTQHIGRALGNLERARAPAGCWCSAPPMCCTAPRPGRQPAGWRRAPAARPVPHPPADTERQPPGGGRGPAGAAGRGAGSR